MNRISCFLIQSIKQVSISGPPSFPENDPGDENNLSKESTVKDSNTLNNPLNGSRQTSLEHIDCVDQLELHKITSFISKDTHVKSPDNVKDMLNNTLIKPKDLYKRNNNPNTVSESTESKDSMHSDPNRTSFANANIYNVTVSNKKNQLTEDIQNVTNIKPEDPYGQYLLPADIKGSENNDSDRNLVSN